MRSGSELMDVDKSTQKAVEAYLLELPEELKKRYGGSGNGPYTAAQVEKTIADIDLSNDHVRYAIAVFCDEETISRSLTADAQILDRLMIILNKISDSGVSHGGPDPAAWVTGNIINVMTGDDVGEIGAEGDAT